MSKSTTIARRQRRSMFRAAGYLKVKSSLGRFSTNGIAWYERTLKDGNESHSANTNRILDEIENQLQSKVNSLKLAWTEIGYNEAEISMLEEAWLLNAIKNKDTRREDKKEVHRLRNEAFQSLNSRLNANS